MATVTQALTWVEIMTCFQCRVSSSGHQNMHDAFISHSSDKCHVYSSGLDMPAGQAYMRA